MWGSSSGHERAVDSRSRRRGNIYPEILGSNHLQSLKMNHWNIGILWNIHMNGNHLLLDISLQPVFFMVFPWFTQPFPMDSGTSWHPSSQRAGFGTRWPGRYSGPRVRRIAATRTAMRPSHGAVGMSYVVGEAADVSVNCFLLVLISRDLFFCFFLFLFVSPRDEVKEFRHYERFILSSSIRMLWRFFQLYVGYTWIYCK
jgi:hypothetical protein